MNEALAVFAQAIGGFYVLAALLAVNKLRMDWFMDKALAQLTLKPTGDKPLLIAITGFAVWYGLAGLALLLRSRWAIVMLGIGLVAQGMLIGWRSMRGNEGPTRQTVHAAGLSLLAFAIAVLAWRAGKLS